MALDQTLTQLNVSTRKLGNWQGVTALLRHPDPDVNDAILQAIGSLHRKLTSAQPDQRYLSFTDISTVSGQTLYPIPSDFQSIISVDLSANGIKVWLKSFNLNERPMLTDPNIAYTGIPNYYRLEGNNIEYLPTANAVYVSRLWYVPSAQQPVGGQAFDTIARLDVYIVAYATRIIATKDKQWDLVNECRNVCSELEEEIDVVGRNRDLNEPGRIVDSIGVNRFGRRFRGSRGWR